MCLRITSDLTVTIFQGGPCIPAAMPAYGIIPSVLIVRNDLDPITIDWNIGNEMVWCVRA